MKKISRSEAGRLGYIASIEINKANYDRRVEKYLSSPKLCASCSSVIPYDKRENRFCGHSCRASYHNPRRAKRRPCFWCKNLLSASQAKYCSKECEVSYKANRAFHSRCPSSRVCKSYLLRTRGHKCEGCLNTEWAGYKIPLELDHIDGDSGNNKEENLRLLCPNCHALTETYKGRNKGRGRAYRRQRYAEGKSF